MSECERDILAACEDPGMPGQTLHVAALCAVAIDVHGLSSWPARNHAIVRIASRRLNSPFRMVPARTAQVVQADVERTLLGRRRLQAQPQNSE